MDVSIKLEPKPEIYDEGYPYRNEKEEPIEEAIVEAVTNVKIEDNMVIQTEANSLRIVSYGVPSAPEAVGTRRTLKGLRVPESSVEDSVDGRRFPCHICGKRFLALYVLQMHLSVHSGARPYKCSICSAVFPSKTSMMTHAKLHTDGPKRYKCRICIRAFKTMTNLRKHASVHSDLKSFLCGQCGTGFKRKQALTDHIVRHKRKSALECLKCGKVLGCRMEFVKHMRKHSDEAGLKCTMCRLHFEERHLLVAHFETVHALGEGGRLRKQVFTCEICGQLTENLSKANQHRMTHSSHRPFSCTACSKAFKRKSHLVEHLVTHSLYFFCRNCHACFKIKCDLDGHRSDSYECRKCNACFRSPEKLRAHVYNHTPAGRSPSLLSQDNECVGDGGSSKTSKFPCRMCNKYLRSANYRRLHEEKHKGKPYECIFCDSRFVTKANLVRHFRLYHFDNWKSS